MINFNVFVDAWLAALWRASWQGGILLLVVLAFSHGLPTMPARFHAWLWRLVLVKFVVALFWSVPVELPVLPAAQGKIAKAIAPAGVFLSPPSEVAASVPTPTPSFMAHLANVCTPWQLVLAAWGSVVGWQWVRLGIECRNASRLRKNSLPLHDATWHAQLAEVSPWFGLKTPPRLLETKGKGSPLLVGIFRPAIIVPVTTLRRLDPSERTTVIAHELAHLCRCDLLWTLVAAMVRSVFFFHPLVWLAERRLKLVQEIAADELAIARQQRDTADYAALLVSIVSKLGPERLHPAMAVGTAGSQDSLKERLVAMRSMKTPSLRGIAAWSVVLAIVGVAGIVPWKLVAAEPVGAIERRLKADDFWAETGAKLTHEGITNQDLNSLRTLAGTSDNATVRIRAFKLLADLGERTRYNNALAEDQVLAAVEGTFRFLEKNIKDETVAKFRPELGFNYVALGPSDMGGIWLLIEEIHPGLLGGGVNVHWNTGTRSVDMVKHWGMNRNPPPPINDKPEKGEVEKAFRDAKARLDLLQKALANDPRKAEPPLTQHVAVIKISQRAPGKEKVLLCEPTLVLVAGNKAEIQTVAKNRRVEATVESDLKKQPVEHSVVVKIVDNPDTKESVTLQAPRISLYDGQAGTVIGRAANGDEVEIFVKIERDKLAE